MSEQSAEQAPTLAESLGMMDCNALIAAAFRLEEAFAPEGQSDGDLAKHEQIFISSVLAIVSPAVERIVAERERIARAEALDVAALLLSKVVDYWDGRPTTIHGQHIYADMRDVLAGIKGDAEHNRTARAGGGDDE